MARLPSRTAALEKLGATAAGDPLDLLVVGGGITGAGIALDASSRGMTVGLVERLDFASGTSSKSSKLVHGGLRYLEQREFGLVREASVERLLLARLAPHLVEPMQFVIPVSSRWRRAQFGVGLWAYDALATFRNTGFHRYLSRSETETLVPLLPSDKVRGGFGFYDSKTDDVRLVMENLIQAARLGAVPVNYAEVTALEGSEAVCSAHVRDVVSGGDLEVRARRVVVAAGVWTEQLDALASAQEENIRLRPSKGVHLVFRKDALPMGDAAAFIPDAERKRMLFVIPWLDSVIVGTTDTAYEGDLDAPSVEEADRRYCLDAVNSAFELDLGPADIAGAYAGLRPLIQGKSGATADLSRRHALYDIAPGVAAITGGKLTTYRRMAADAVDRVARDLEVTARSKTRWVKLGCSSLPALTAAVTARTRRLGIPPEAAANLIRCYGDRALAVLDLAARADLARPLVPGHLPIAAEAVYCARAEMATNLDDLLARRTRLTLTDPAAGIGTGSLAAEVMGRERGWRWRATRRQVEMHRHKVEAERGMPLGPAVPRSPDRTRATGG